MSHAKLSTSSDRVVLVLGANLAVNVVGSDDLQRDRVTKRQEYAQASISAY